MEYSTTAGIGGFSVTTVSTQRSTDVELMAQLLRRAGFGATRDQIDGYLEQGYEATVEELLYPVHGLSLLHI